MLFLFPFLFSNKEFFLNYNFTHSPSLNWNETFDWQTDEVPKKYFTSLYISSFNLCVITACFIFSYLPFH